MKLDTKAPVGNGVSKPVPATYEASKSMNVTLNSSNGLETNASQLNLSAKFKYPQKKQDKVAEDTIHNA